MSAIIRSYNSLPIRQREDGYLSLTDMAQAAGKRVNHWRENITTAEFLSELSSVTGIPATGTDAGCLLETRQGGTPSEQGTWAHPLAASNFAQWASPAFAVKVALWIEEIRVHGWAIDARRAAPVLDVAAFLRTPEGLQSMALELTRIVEEQAAQLQRQTPAVEAHARLMAATGAISLMDAGRVLGRKPRLWINSLLHEGYLCRNGQGTLVPTADYREKGIFEVVTLPVPAGDDEDKARIQTRVTTIGLDFFSKKYARTDVDGCAPLAMTPRRGERSH